ncbi:MAG: PorV/PorQ family protein [Ignavibacteria bacterium]|jgi:hypothetical protein|nr:PorV/PorQ family protein [Ignavibacteria bacterium]
MKKLNIQLLLTIALTLLFAGNGNAEDATPYSFLSTALSPRAAGIGGSGLTLENDAGSVFLNPALIYTNVGKNFSATFQKHLLDINSGNATYIFKDTTYGRFAVSAVYTNYGSFDYYNEYGDATGGSFSGNLVALSGTYANEIAERLYGGVTVKFIFNQIENMNGFAFAVDAGLLYKLDDERTNIGFSILNAGTEIKKFESSTSRIPLDVRLGFNHRLQGLPLLFNIGFNHLGQDGDFGERFANINVGGELYFGDYVRVRVGYDNYIRKNYAASSSKGLSGFSVGAGVVTDVVNVDYSINVVTGDLLLHRFGVSLEF